MTIASKNTSIYLSLFLFHILVTGFVTFIANSDYLTSMHNGNGFWNITIDSSLYHREAITQLGYLNNYEWLNWAKSYAAHQNVKLISLSYWISGFSNPLSFAMINTLTWLLSVILIFKSSKLLFPKIHYLPFLIIIFFVQPSILFNSTQLLRDPFFLLGACFFIYGWVLLDKDYPRWYWFFYMVCGLILTVSMRSYLFPIFAFSIIGYMFWVVFKKKWMIFPFGVLLSLLTLYSFGGIDSKIKIKSVSTHELRIQKLMLSAYSDENFSLEDSISLVIKEQNKEKIQKSLNYKKQNSYEKQRIQEKLSNNIMFYNEEKEISKNDFLLKVDSAYRLIEKKKENNLKDFLLKNSSNFEELKLQHESLLKNILAKVDVDQSGVDKLKKRFLIELEEFELIEIKRLNVINQTAIDEKKIIEEELSSQLEVEMNINKYYQDNLVAQSLVEFSELILIDKRKMEVLEAKHKSDVQKLKLFAKSKVKNLQKIEDFEVAEDLEVVIELAEEDNKIFLTLDKISNHIGNLRQVFQGSSQLKTSTTKLTHQIRENEGGSGIDQFYRISTFNNLLSYLPRAAQISFLAPFPSDWLREGNEAGKIGIVLAAVEMILWYSILTGFLYLCFINLISMKSLIPVFICAFITIILIGYAVPNVGAIFRMRQAFMLPFFIFGFYGLHILFNKFYVKYIHN